MMTELCGKILTSFDESQPLTPKKHNHHTVSTEKMSSTDALLLNTHNNTITQAGHSVDTEQWVS